MVSLNYSTKNIHVSEPIHIYRKSGLVILGDFPDQQVLLCDFGAGIAFEDVENVCIENIAFQGCSIPQLLTLVLMRPSRVFLQPCFSIILKV